MKSQKDKKAEPKNNYKVKVYPDGSLMEVKKDAELKAGGKPPSDRSIKKFSRDSARRLRNELAKIDWTSGAAYAITLTYPADFPDKAAAIRRHIHLFQVRLRERFPEAGGILKLEPQKRGAPHWHIAFFGLEPYLKKNGGKWTITRLRAWIASTWYRHVGSGDTRHLKAGTQVVEVKGTNAFIRYFAKYLTKACEAVLPDGLRYWRRVNRAAIPYSECLEVDLDEGGFQALRRLARRYVRSQSRTARDRKILKAAGDDAADGVDALLAEKATRGYLRRIGIRLKPYQPEKMVYYLGTGSVLLRLVSEALCNPSSNKEVRWYNLETHRPF